MANDAQITVTGNTTRDPEVKVFDSGASLVRLGVAVNTRKKNKDSGDWEDGPPSFFDVVVFGDMGDNAASSLPKGTRVMVTGRMQVRDWENAEAGTKGRAAEIIADEIGPSLRWATATIAKTAKKGNGGGAPVEEADYL